jgi:hypothetical protein
VTPIASQFDIVFALTNHFGHCLFRIKRATVLIKIANLYINAPLDAA